MTHGSTLIACERMWRCFADLSGTSPLFFKRVDRPLKRSARQPLHSQALIEEFTNTPKHSGKEAVSSSTQVRTLRILKGGIVASLFLQSGKEHTERETPA
jgi:hypothetical protein